MEPRSSHIQGKCSTPELLPQWHGCDFLKVINTGLALVAHTCNPSYSGGRDQEDPGSKPTGANSSRDPILKKKASQKGLVKWFKV
jgi:hypothetical protein